MNELDPAVGPTAPTRRWWFQFSLATLMWLTTFAACLAALWAMYRDLQTGQGRTEGVARRGPEVSRRNGVLGHFRSEQDLRRAASGRQGLSVVLENLSSRKAEVQALYVHHDSRRRVSDFGDEMHTGTGRAFVTHLRNRRGTASGDFTSRSSAAMASDLDIGAYGWAMLIAAASLVHARQARAGIGSGIVAIRSSWGQPRAGDGTL